VSINVERDLHKLASEVDEEAYMVTVHPDVAVQLVGAMGETIDEIERRLKCAVYVRASEHLHVEKYEIVPGNLQEIEKQMLPYKSTEMVECQVVRNPFSMLPRSTAWLDGYLVDLSNGGKYIGQRVRARLTDIRRSYALGEVVAGGKLLDKPAAS
jgi:hypothetical protein